MSARSTVEVAPIRIRAKRIQHPVALIKPTETESAAARQNAQLPGFAPLLEELEVAGWSSHRRALSGNFHDWMLLQQRTLLVMAGHATSAESVDPIEAALVAQGAWAAIRSHAQHATDAGTLLSLTAKTLWPIASAGVQASVAVALVDLDGGHASVATAGDCLALKIRATGSEQIAAISRRLALIASICTPAIRCSFRCVIEFCWWPTNRRGGPRSWRRRITSSFARLDAESHRRMMAADAVGLVRELYDEQADDEARPSASIVAVRRR